MTQEFNPLSHPKGVGTFEIILYLNCVIYLSFRFILHSLYVAHTSICKLITHAHHSSKSCAAAAAAVPEVYALLLCTVSRPQIHYINHHKLAEPNLCDRVWWFPSTNWNENPTVFHNPPESILLHVVVESSTQTVCMLYSIQAAARFPPSQTPPTPSATIATNRPPD